MAKYTITMGCGHEDTIELYGSGKERKSRIDYLEANGTCKACWAAAKRAEQEATPLTVTVDMIPYELKVMLSFSGNTMPVKDDIKALGYKWGEKAPAGALGIFGKPEKAWHKIINPEDIETELPKLAGLNPQIKNNISPIDMAMWQQKLASQAEQQERVDAVKASMPKPVRPEKLTAGARWNGKIYGKSGYKNIYLDNVKINLTDAEAQEIETWQAEVAKYNKAIADAKKG
jgi:hypothetical protein